MKYNVILIIIASTLPYLFTLNGDFVFDDSEAIVKNKDVISNKISEAFLHDFWGTDVASNFSHKSYRPLTVLSFRLNYHLSGKQLNPFHFKITNLICHITCCVLIWCSYKAILKYVCYGRKLTDEIALFAALLFAVHPIHVEAVSGIVGRADELAAGTYFASLLLYNRAIQTTKVMSCMFTLLAISCAGLSMLFKENGITVLGFCLLYEFLNKKLLKITRLPHSKQASIRFSIIRLMLLTSGAVLLLTLRWRVMGRTKPEFKPIDNPAAFSDSFITRILTFNYIYALNIVLLVWPQWLCFDWSMDCVPLIRDILDVRLIVVLTFYLYGFAVICYLKNRGNSLVYKKSLFLALCLIVVPFLPASNMLFPVGFVVAERILYIPSAGFCLLVCIGMNKLKGVTDRKYFKVSKLFYVLLIVFALRTWQRSRQWQNEYELFTSGMSVCPLNAKVHYNVAKVADANMETVRAVKEYEEAIRLYPEYYQAMNNLANLLKNEGKYTEAKYYLEKAIGYKKDFPAAWMNLGIVYANTKRFEESREAYRVALSYRGHYPDCYYNLGNLFLELNKTDEAMKAWNQAIAQNPKHNLAWTNLLALLDNTGQTDLAIKVIPRALMALPQSASVNFAIGNVYGKMELYRDAEAHFKRAIQLFGDKIQPIHFANLGVLYHRWKKFKKAEEMYKAALKLDPNFRSAQKNLISLSKLKLDN